MRLQNKNVLLKLVVEHTANNGIMTIDAYNSKFESLPLQRNLDTNRETIEITTTLPNIVVLVLSGKDQTNCTKSIKLLTMSLAGIKINNSILTRRIDYRPNKSNTPFDSVSDYLNNQSLNSTVWDSNGCVVFDLFDPDPFSYLLHIGNKIQF